MINFAVNFGLHSFSVKLKGNLVRIQNCSRNCKVHAKLSLVPWYKDVIDYNATVQMNGKAK